MKRRFVRLGLVGLGLVALVGAGASPAAAKKKKKTKTRTVTRTATFSQCVSVASPILSSDATGGPAVGTAQIPVDIPTFKGLPQDGIVTAVGAVGARITHTYDGDLGLVLVSPGARAVPLALNRGGTGENYGTGAASCAGALTLFADAAVNPIGTGTPPFTGAFKPERPLIGLVGSQARGLWILAVTDGASGDDGALHAFSLSFTYTYLAQEKVKKKRKKK